MKVVIRTDASVEIGTGHMMRCLTLAETLGNNGAEVLFICRDLPGDYCDFIAAKGYDVYRIICDNSSKDDAVKTKNILNHLVQSIDLLIVDHYGLDKQWEKELRSQVKKIMVIDDFENRFHDCDFILNQNPILATKKTYEVFVPEDAIKYLGLKYALLNKKYSEAREKMIRNNKGIRRLLISFGGVDATNETAKVLNAIQKLDYRQLAIDVVVGEANPHKQQIQSLCADMENTQFYCQADNLAQLMINADLAFGGCGLTAWERCCLGLPSVIIILSDNQRENANYLNEKGGCINLGWHEAVSVKDIKDCLGGLLEKPDAVFGLSQRAAKMVDGKGVNRLVSSLCDYFKKEVKK